MQTNEDHLKTVEIDKRPTFTKLYQTIKNNIPAGFVEELTYKMIGFVVPKSVYPSGYDCNSKLPLPFINLAANKNYISLHHLGLYFDASLLDWFQSEYPKYCNTKLDMGKGCIRFKKMDDIPFDLISELIQKSTVEKWITIYENHVKK